MKSQSLRPLCLCALLCVLSSLAVRAVPEAGHGDAGAPLAKVTDDGPALVVERFADAPMVKNITAICFDAKGALYVAETYRFRHGVEDNRDHRYWLMDDVRSETTAHRHAMYEKWIGNFSSPDYFTRSDDRILRLRDLDGDGKADESVVFAEGFNAAVDGPLIGLMAGKPGSGRVYATSIPHLWALTDADGDGKAEARESLQEGFGPHVSLSGHDLHGLAWGPDGKIYFSLGDRGFNLTTRDGHELKDLNAGAAFRCNPDGSELEVYYHQLRNPQELAFNEFGDLFTVDNNSDQGDQSRVIYLIEGGNAGWISGNQNLTTFADDIEDGGLGEQPFWLTEDLWKPRFEGQAEWVLPPAFNLTNGPSGLVFDSGLSLPERYRNHFLICDYKGSAAQSALYSFKVDQAGAGYAVRDPHAFHKGVTNTDVDLGADGKIYLADYGGGWQLPGVGTVFTLSVAETIGNPVVVETRAILEKGFTGLKGDALMRLLAHPDKRVRQGSQFELASRGAESVAVFAKVAHGDGDLLARLHALWGLRQLGAVEALRPLLASGETEIRAQAVKMLGDLKDTDSGSRFIALLGDESPRVRSFAGIALGRLKHGQATAAVLGMLEKNADRDLFVRHGGVMALAGIADDPALRNLATHSSRSVRLATVLALRRHASPEIAVFLDDADGGIVDEVIRAINDVPIEGAMETLADYSAGIASGEVPERPMFRRLLNANLRSSDPRHAANLLAMAANRALPADYRKLALLFLENWLAPPPIDPTMGVYRPLPARDPLRERAADLMGDSLRALVSDAPPEVTATGVKVAEMFGIALDGSLLEAWMLDGAQADSVRIAAIERLAAEPPAGFAKALLALLESPVGTIRAAAGTARARAFPLDAMVAVERLFHHGQTGDLRAAYRILSTSALPDAVARLGIELDALATGRIAEEVRLDLYLAAASSTASAVMEKLRALDATLAAKGETAAVYALHGGDAGNGGNVFLNQGMCLKCHKIDRQGGEAGPNLSDVALRLKPEEIFQSLMNPNAVMVDGYGICSVTLKNGDVLSGSPVGETETELSLKGATAEPIRISKATIATRTPVVSPMPPMGQVLPRTDLRDLLAYLATLKTRPQ